MVKKEERMRYLIYCAFALRFLDLKSNFSWSFFMHDTYLILFNFMWFYFVSGKNKRILYAYFISSLGTGSFKRSEYLKIEWKDKYTWR